MQKGTIIKIIGPVVDVRFPDDAKMPPIYTALTIEHKGRKIFFEVAKHVEPGIIRAIALGSTDGLRRGMEVENTNSRISVPVGPETLGKIFDVVGNALNDPEKKFSKKITYSQESPFANRAIYKDRSF